MSKTFNAESNLRVKNGNGHHLQSQTPNTVGQKGSPLMVKPVKTSPFMANSLGLLSWRARDEKSALGSIISHYNCGIAGDEDSISSLVAKILSKRFKVKANVVIPTKKLFTILVSYLDFAVGGWDKQTAGHGDETVEVRPQ